MNDNSDTVHRRVSLLYTTRNIDPNTGVFAFRDLRSFNAFLALYWRSMLATAFTTGTVCR
ncbi:hypothetical protein HMI49_19990 [Corallococcus exercitus]|uniref:Uncharacterized protein n=1 Tax=Corallococcus exercitus TaxID=2316736 RepID=A0A7Y4KKI0_9BACT|nr:hypothetical protein [Corallococcus exercitus]NOK35488.1 hypothetical protein [Corallococcus exercitus]